MKESIYSKCNQLLETRKKNLLIELDQLKISQESETKSSMGDKYETAREMINSEKSKLAEQLEDIQKMQSFLTQLKPEEKKNSAEVGAVITTEKGIFYLSVSIGRIDLEGSIIFAVSPVSPIGQAMLGKKAGESFILNGTRQKITSIE